MYRGSAGAGFPGQTGPGRDRPGGDPGNFAHNIETVPRLFPAVRPQGNYRPLFRGTSLGEGSGGAHEIRIHGRDGRDQRRTAVGPARPSRSAAVQIVSIGQYLQPTKAHLVVHRYYEPEEFEGLKQHGIGPGLSARGIRSFGAQFLSCRTTNAPCSCIKKPRSFTGICYAERNDALSTSPNPS